MEIPTNFCFYDPEKAIYWLKSKINKLEEKHIENVEHCLKQNIEKLLIRIFFLTLIFGRVQREAISKGKCQSGP